MQQKKFNKNYWVLYCSDIELKNYGSYPFLYKTNGEWGPAYLPTVYLPDAVKFDSKEEAESWIRLNKTGWHVKSLKIAVTFKICTF